MKLLSFARRGVLAAAALALVFTLCSCELMNSKQGRSSSVVSFLYPKTAKPISDQTIPVLNLPLRVGIAFVPANDGRSAYEGVSEMQKTALMGKVRDAFKKYPFVQSIEIVPTMYLRPAGGFDNLDQLKGLMGIDVIVLLAYDQAQFTDSNFLSLAYWTIVGAYVVQGNKNDTHTLMEAAVYDIQSRHLLFRAPGASQIKASSTAVGVDAELRKASGQGFDEATQDLIKNLDTSLADFRERAKNAPTEVQITHKPGYSGGAFDGLLASALAALALSSWLVRRRR